MYAAGGKRVMDVAVATLLLVAVCPLLVVVGLVSVVVQGGPVLFSQMRAGRNESTFSVLKLRTMDVDASLSPEDRIAPWGALLRRSSLDELPQLINVLKGDMSLVGPRPLPVRYNNLYSKRQRTRLRVRPGLTGLAQVSGRNALSWSEKFELDAQYVETVSFVGDLKILWGTVGVVISDVLGRSPQATFPSDAFEPDQPSADTPAEPQDPRASA